MHSTNKNTSKQLIKFLSSPKKISRELQLKFLLALYLSPILQMIHDFVGADDPSTWKIYNINNVNLYLFCHANFSTKKQRLFQILQMNGKFVHLSTILILFGVNWDLFSHMKIWLSHLEILFLTYRVGRNLVDFLHKGL